MIYDAQRLLFDDLREAQIPKLTVRTFPSQSFGIFCIAYSLFHERKQKGSFQAQKVPCSEAAQLHLRGGDYALFYSPITIPNSYTVCLRSQHLDHDQAMNILEVVPLFIRGSILREEGFSVSHWKFRHGSKHAKHESTPKAKGIEKAEEVGHLKHQAVYVH